MEKDRSYFTNLAKEKYPDWNLSSENIREMFLYRNQIWNEYRNSVEGIEAERERIRIHKNKIVAVLNQPKKPRKSFHISLNFY